MTNTSPKPAYVVSLTATPETAPVIEYGGARGGMCINRTDAAVDVEVWTAITPDGDWYRCSGLDFTVPAEEGVELPTGLFAAHFVKLVVPAAVASVPVYILMKA